MFYKIFIQREFNSLFIKNSWFFSNTCTIFSFLICHLVAHTIALSAVINEAQRKNVNQPVSLFKDALSIFDAGTEIL